MISKCRNCLLPGVVPGADLDTGGVCRYCREFDTAQDKRIEAVRRQREVDLEKAIESCRGQAEYDAVVCLSGGKDSVYLAHKLVTLYKLRVLAITTDVNIPLVAWKNIKRTIGRLRVDHLVYRPQQQFYRKLFRYLLRNQEERGAVYTVSYVYAPLFEGDALRVATEKGIPLVLAGYSPGQPDPERMSYEFSRRLLCDTDWTPPHLKECGQFDEGELSRFWNPIGRYSADSIPRYIAPFHAWEYDQDQIMKAVVRLGLIARAHHANPVFSNYPINWLLMYSDILRFGYNPYAPEFSELIRKGKAKRNYWRVAAPIVDSMIRRKVFLGREIKRSMRWLELKKEDLRITQPRGAYDPPLSDGGEQVGAAEAHQHEHG